MIAAPVHKHDQNIIQGTFGPIKPPQFPAVAGTEGLGIIEETGSACSLGMGVGDMVWINNPAVGTWATHIVTDEANLDVMPNRADIEVEFLSMLSCYHTAHHLLEDFVNLMPGDVVLQTGATSTVAQASMAMARARGVKLILGMQDGRTEHKMLITRFKTAGAHIVVNYNYARGNLMRRLLSDLPPPKLMLNHVGGTKAAALLKHLGNDGVCVSYGSALSKPLQVANLDIIGRGLKFNGFFLPRWNANNSRERRMRIHQNLIEQMTLSQGHSYVRAQRYKFDTDSAFAFVNAWDAPCQAVKQC